MTDEEKSKPNKNSLLVISVVALVVGVAAFLGGMKYQQTKSTTRFSGFNGEKGQFVQRMGGPSGNEANFQPINGEIISSDETSVTIKLQDGSSKIVLLSDSTSINKAESGSKEDLKEGEKVLVLGNSNSDGSVSAQSIQLNPPDRVIFRQENQ